MSAGARDLRDLFETGQLLRSLDPRDEGRTVRVTEVHRDKIRVRRVGNGRRSYLRWASLKGGWARV